MWLARLAILLMFMLVRLKVCQILKAEHYAWVSALIRHQILQLDASEDPTAELTENIINNVLISRQLAVAPPPEIKPRFILGSKQPKQLVIEDLQRTSSADFDSAFTSFRSRVSRAIQLLSSQPTNAIYDSQGVLLTPSMRCFTMDLNYV